MIRQIAQWLHSSERILVITGAGVSADSGMPTYRGIGGLYTSGNTEEGLPIEVMLSHQTLVKQPQLCWKYISQLESNCRHAKPNATHTILAQLENERPHLWVLTQNVDGFHRQAGTKNLIEIHGNFEKLYCMKCGASEEVDNYAHLTLPPTCNQCGGTIRPNVILFGEALPDQEVNKLYTQLGLGFDLILSVGTTSSFPYIIEPIARARMQGVPTAEINPGTTEVSHVVDVKLNRGAADAFTAIWDEFQTL